MQKNPIPRFAYKKEPKESTQNKKNPKKSRFLLPKARFFPTLPIKLTSLKIQNILLNYKYAECCYNNNSNLNIQIEQMTLLENSRKFSMSKNSLVTIIAIPVHSCTK